METCPEWAATGLREQHISADISLSVWQYYSVTNDVEWLKTIGMPILTGVADFVLSRAEFDGDTAHINGVIPPDEYVDMVDDSVYTNFAAAEALRFALLGAEEAGVVLEKAAAYAELSSALVLIYDEKLGIHPEYRGYNGSIIKQADAVMLHYPWGMEMEATVQQADLEYYAARSDETIKGGCMLALKTSGCSLRRRIILTKPFKTTCSHPLWCGRRLPLAMRGTSSQVQEGFSKL